MTLYATEDFTLLVSTDKYLRYVHTSPCVADKVCSRCNTRCPIIGERGDGLAET